MTPLPRAFVRAALAWSLGTISSLAIAGAALGGPPNVSGSWSPVYSWPDVAVHLHVLPDGKILAFADDDNPNYPVNGARLAGSTKTFVVDIPIDGVPGSVIALPNSRTNMFCSGHSFVPDGRLLVVGGHLGKDGWGETNTELFDYRSGYSWSAGEDMFQGRWYPSSCVLANGDVLAISGTMDSTVVWASIPEVWSSTTGHWRQLTNANRVLPYYPFTFLAPNGKVFCAGPNVDSRYLDCNGLGSWSFVANHVGNFNRTYGSAVQYADGKILVVGGGDPPTTTCEVIDLNAGTPAWSSTTAGAMNYARRQCNATILPDGTVLATGGSSASGFNNNAGAVLPAELWTPPPPGGNGSWTVMASMVTPRLYHSTAALLPDGRVLSAGGGRPKADNGGSDHLDAEIFSPPYLFKGTRPTITSAPAVVNNGVAFTIQTPDAASITQVTMVRLTTTTHAFNQGQRFNRLTFSVGSGAVQATVPSSSALAPPGYYMLFILNGNGVPSIAKMIQVVVPGPVGVEDQPETRLLDFMALRSPNPGRGQVRIAFALSHSEEATIDVLDVAGRLVKTVAEGFFAAGHEQVVTWDGLDAAGARVASGLYWYRLRTPSVTRTGKIALLSH